MSGAAPKHPVMHHKKVGVVANRAFNRPSREIYRRRDPTELGLIFELEAIESAGVISGRASQNGIKIFRYLMQVVIGIGSKVCVENRGISVTRDLLTSCAPMG